MEQLRHGEGVAEQRCTQPIDLKQSGRGEGNGAQLSESALIGPAASFLECKRYRQF